MDSLNAFMAAVGVKIASLLPASLGGFASLTFFDQVTDKKKRWCIALSGIAVGVFGAGGAIEYLKFKIPTLSDTAALRIEMALCFFIGLFGMAVAAAIVKAFPDFIQAVRSRLGPKGD